MVSPISHATQSSQSEAQPVAARQPAAQAKSQPTADPADTVKLSSAQLIQQEAVETPVQPPHEASAGDSQARNLLAREAAAKAKG
ncbi:MAG: hypothetical protein JWO91_1198 [Acidobacteriaceae bacterium]|nr:hypothetical protein [Acidobacteriaceae bacterium]